LIDDLRRIAKFPGNAQSISKSSIKNQQSSIRG
jgi:hypothetical protein